MAARPAVAVPRGVAAGYGDAYNLNLTNLIQLGRPATANNVYNFDDSITAYAGDNASPTKFYSANGLPSIDPDTTVTGSELAAFASWYYTNYVLMTPYGIQRAYYLEKFMVALAGLYMAKSNIGIGGEFGVGVQGSLHTQQIRPETVLDLTISPTPSADVTTWSRSVTQGWNTSFFVFNTNNASNTPTALANTQNTVNFLVWGLIDQSIPSKVQAYKVIGPGSKNYGVECVNILNLTSQEEIIAFPAAFFVQNKETWSIDVEFNTAGTEYLIPDGIQFVNTQYYQLET